jgi:hypothetical protein
VNRIGLVDVDSSKNFPNLPLMKLSAYRKKRGDYVTWAAAVEHYDVVYMSKIFTFTPDDMTCYNADEVIKGGTGYNLDTKLPDETEHIYPDYSLYADEKGRLKFPEACGFLTRGCPRDCKFCIVSRKEGRCSQQVAELGEFWRGQKVIKLLDPNLLACKDREKILQSLIDSRARIDFTQGLDIRLTDKYIAGMLKQIKIENLHFAWDNPDEDLRGRFEEIKRITGLSHRKLSAYMLTNFNSTHEQDLYRVRELRRIGVHPYTMIYDKANALRVTRRIQAWTNDRRLWESCERFEDLRNIFV